MTRERAIEVLKAWDLNWSDEFTANEFEQAFAMAISALSENKGEWIPISERLPKERQAVLCWAESTAERLDAEFIGMFDRGDWFLQSDANHLSFPHQYKVVAWMPLPEPYKADMRGEANV